MASSRTPDAVSRDGEPLDLTQSQELPPLSPSMARAFSEAFRDDESNVVTQVDGKREGEASGEKGERKLEPEAPPPADDEVCLSSVSSPSPEDMAWAVHNRVRRQPEIMSMSLSETKEEVVDSAKARRARRSEIEKKSRQSRMGALRRMRREMMHLEGVYSAMLERKSWGLGALDGGQYEVSRLASAQELHRKYTDLSLVAHALEEDGVALQKALQDYKEFQREAMALLAERGIDYPQLPENSMSRIPDQVAVYDSGVPPSSSFSAGFKLLTIPECYAFVRETCAAVRRYEESGGFVSTGASLMGYRDRRKYDPKTQKLQFGLSKKFPSEKSAEELLSRTWDIIRDPVQYAKVYFRATVRMRREILQTLDNDCYIVRMDLKRPDSPFTVITVQVVFRIQTPTGFMLVERTIPSPEIKDALEAHEHFYGLFHWSYYNQLYDENGQPSGAELVAGGAIDHVLEQAAKYWLFEVLLYTLRWESYAVAPLFLKV